MPPSTMPELSTTGLSPRTAALLAYSGWWVTGLVFWVVERRDTYVRFHGAQSVAAFGIVALLIGGFCVMAAASLSFLPSAFAPFLIAAAVTFVLGLVLWAVTLWQVGNGHPWRLPLAGDLADRMLGLF